MHAEHSVSIAGNDNASGELRAVRREFDVHHETGVDHTSACVDGGKTKTGLATNRGETARHEDVVVVHGDAANDCVGRALKACVEGAVD